MTGPISVPYLLGRTDGLSLADSLAITKEADRRSPDNTPLVPKDLASEIERWNERSERLMRAGRSRILERTENDKDVAMESLPAHIPPALRGLLSGSVRMGTAFLRKKYAVVAIEDESLVPDLDALRAAIGDKAGEPLLAGRFTAADIAMVTALQAIRPHTTEPVGLAKAQRAAWARNDLASRYEDVLAWRDAILSRYRHSQK